MKRRRDYLYGYRAAWKDAVTYLHDRAEEMDDPRAVAILNHAAFDMGNNCRVRLTPSGERADR